MMFHLLYALLWAAAVNFGLVLGNPAQEAEVALYTCLALEEYIDPWSDCIWPVILDEAKIFIGRGATVNLNRLRLCSEECMDSSSDDEPSERPGTLRICITECFHDAVAKKF